MANHHRHAHHGRTERQPHIFGAHPLQYRGGAYIARGETPPTWCPEQADDTAYLYTLAEFQRDASRWMASTKVPREGRAPLLALAIGGVGRRITDDLDDNLLVNGAEADLGDGLGLVHRFGPRLLFFALERAFPANLVAEMLRAGLEFFSFQTRSGESVARGKCCHHLLAF